MSEQITLAQRRLLERLNSRAWDDASDCRIGSTMAALRRRGWAMRLPTGNRHTITAKGVAILGRTKPA